MEKFVGKTALVTGAAKGIGKGCALELARAGADLAIADIDEAALLKTSDEILALGVRCLPFVSNVFKKKHCHELTKVVAESLGGIDILVSNPSWNQRGNFLDYDPKVFVATIHCTLIAAFFISQPVARHMVDRGKGGNIIFISSDQAILPFSRSPAYNAAKRGLEAFAETIAVDLAENKIRVNTIRPGWIDTVLERSKYGAALDNEGSKIPLGRLGTPEDIGRTVVAICSLHYFTGQHFGIDGGLSFRHLKEMRREPDKTDNVFSPIPDYD